MNFYVILIILFKFSLYSQVKTITIKKHQRLTFNLILLFNIYNALSNNDNSGRTCNFLMHGTHIYCMILVASQFDSEIR